MKNRHDKYEQLLSKIASNCDHCDIVFAYYPCVLVCITHVLCNTVEGKEICIRPHFLLLFDVVKQGKEKPPFVCSLHLSGCADLQGEVKELNEDERLLTCIAATSDVEPEPEPEP